MADVFNIPKGTKVGSLIGKPKPSNGTGRSSRSQRKITVVYDASGKVTQSNDPSRPVGTVDTSKRKESVLSKTPSLAGKSVVLKRTGSKITQTTFTRGGKKETTTIQDESTPKSKRKTTSQLAKEFRAIKRAQESRAFKQAQSKVLSGTASAKDLINYASFGTGNVRNILANQPLNRFVRSQVEYDNFRREVSKQLNPQQKAFVKTLSTTEQDKYLFQVASRRVQPVKKEIIKKKLTQTRKLSGVSNVVASKLENWAIAINKRGKEAERKQALNEAKILAESVAREELVSQYVPKGFKTIGRVFNALIKLGEKTFTGSLGFGSVLANTSEKVLFLLPAFGKSLSDRRVKEFGREFVTGEQGRILKTIYTDPKTYRDALIGAGVMTILGGVRSGKLTAKNVKKFGKTTRKYPHKTILRDAQGNLGYVSKSGVIKPVPKGVKVLTRALTRDLARTKQILGKTKIGTVYRGIDGKIRVQTKGGRVRLVKPSEARVLVKKFKAKAKLRAKKTEKARVTKAKAKKGLTKKELKSQQLKLQEKQINSEINRLNKRFRLKGKELKEFKQAYKEFKFKGTKKSIKKLQEISDNIEVSKGIKTLDRLIKKDLAKGKVKTVTKKTIPKKTAKGRISELERKALRKPLNKKEALELKKLKLEFKKAERFQAKIKADKEAQSKGFKNFEEQFKYEKAFREYQKGSVKAEKVLKVIEKKLLARKNKASKLRAKKIEAQRKKIVEEALKQIKEGRRTLKEQVKPSKLKSKTKLSNEEIIKLGKQVESKLKLKTNLKSVKSDKLQLVQRVKAKSKVKRVTRAKTLPKLRSIKGRTITSALVSSGSLISSRKRKLSLTNNIFQSISPEKANAGQRLRDLVRNMNFDLAKLNDLKIDLTNLQGLGEDLTNIQKQSLAQDKIEIQKLESKYKELIKKSKSKIKKPVKPIAFKLPPLPRINWNTKLPKGYSFIVNARYKKGNKVITRRLKTTPNRARKIMNQFIDNSPQASYDLVVVGARKVKDIKKQSMAKFTVRKGKDPKVRRNVEKTKFRLDRPKEKAISRIKRKPTKKRSKKRK